MRGYPKRIATKQDFINLLETSEFKAQALKDLGKICDPKNEKAFRSYELTNFPSGEKIQKMELITAQRPPWKAKGFHNIQDVENMIKDNGGKITPKIINWENELRERQTELDKIPEHIENK